MHSLKHSTWILLRTEDCIFSNMEEDKSFGTKTNWLEIQSIRKSLAILANIRGLPEKNTFHLFFLNTDYTING